MIYNLCCQVPTSALLFIKGSYYIALWKLPHPHHITQRGDNGQGVFFTVFLIGADRRACLGILAEESPSNAIQTIKSRNTPQFNRRMSPAREITLWNKPEIVQ